MLISQILMLLDDPGELDRDLVRDVAAEYAEAVVAVNERLGQIGALLNRGLRGEALQSAEREPRVLDLVAELDFPGLDRWTEILRELGLQAPPRLRMSIAQDVDRAFDEQAGLEGLLRKHRLLALGRAPLSQRMDVLRAIRQQDPLNPVWNEDLEAWERARLTQIAGEVKGLQRAGNRAGLIALQRELAKPWLLASARSLRTQVQQATQSVEGIWATNELQQVSVRLHNALVALDVEAGSAARAEWQQLLPLARLAGDHPLHQSAAEALHWLAEEDHRVRADQAFSGALDKLEKVLDRRGPLTDLDRVWYEVQKFEREIPALLQDRATRLKQDLENAGQRRSRTIVALVSLGLVAVAVLAGITLQRRSARSAVTDGLASLTAARDSGSFETARRIHEGFPDSVRNDPAVVALWTELEGRARQEENRVREFAAALQRAEEPGLDNPRFDLIEEAKRLAVTDAEQERAIGLERQAQRRQTDLLAERSNRFRTELDALTTRLAALERGGGSIPSAQMSEVREQLESLLNGHSGTFLRSYPKVNPVDLNRIPPLIQRIDSHFAGLAALEQQRKSLAQLASGIGNPDAFFAGLQQARDSTQDPAVRADLESSLEESGDWRGFLAWQALAARPDWESLALTSRETAESLLAELAETEQQHPGFVFSSLAQPAAGYLALKAALEPEEAVRERLTEWLSSQELGQLYVVVVEDGGSQRRYYSKLPPEQDERALKFKYFDNLQLLDETPRTQLLNLGGVKYHGLAPHVRIVRRLREKLEQESTRLPELSLELVRIIMNDQPGEGEIAADPVVRVILLEKVLEECKLTDLSLERVTTLVRKEASQTMASRADWVEPDNENAEVRRQGCSVFLERHRSLGETLATAIADEHQKVTRLGAWIRQTGYHWAGYVAPVETGGIGVHWRHPPRGNMQLFAVMRDGDPEGKIQMKPIGRVVDSRWEPGPASLLRTGRPVFCRVEDVDQFQPESGDPAAAGSSK